mgnify:CR=1 FL=1
MKMHAQDSAEPYEGTELYKLRHTAAHVMAQAVLELFPGAKMGIGPPVTDGFYYDFDLGTDDNGRPIEHWDVISPYPASTPPGTHPSMAPPRSRTGTSPTRPRR